MGMTIDEAIKRAEEVVEVKEEQAWEAQLQEEYRTIESCKECAEEHRQLAEWLKDYKRLLEQELIYNSAESKLKNPKAKTFDVLRFVADNAGLSNFEAIEKAYHMGVSEQECILDKIRVEIERQEKWLAQAGYNAYNVDIAFKSIKNILRK